MIAPRTLALALAVTLGCGGGPQKVGGQPSWRQRPTAIAPDAVALAPATAMVVTLRPTAKGVTAYNDPPRTPAPSSPVGDAIAAEIAALAPPDRIPVADGRLYAAATDLAAIIPAEGMLPYPIIEFALQHRGVIEPSPNMLVVWGPLDQPALLVEHLRPRLAELLHAEPERAFGIGTAPRGERAAVVVMLQPSFVETQPIPRALPVDGAAPLVGRVAANMTRPEAFATGSDGAVRHIALTVNADGSFRGEVRCAGQRGRMQVEIAADDHTGATVLANFPVWCGEPAPTEVTAAVDADDAIPVASVADAEARLLRLLNRDRAAAGLPALAHDAAVADVARGHSDDMFTHGFVGHISPTTGSAADRTAAAGIKSAVVLENIARAYGPAEAQAGLMNSPGHRANALSRAATHVGIGVTLGDLVAGRRELYVTQVYIRITPPIDPAAAHAELVPRFTADGTTVDADLDAIARDFAAALARGVPRDDAKRAVSRRLDAIAGRLRQAATVVTAVADLAEVDPAKLTGDMGADRVGVGVAQGDHPELGPGAYWIVVVLGRSR